MEIMWIDKNKVFKNKTFAKYISVVYNNNIKYNIHISPIEILIADAIFHKYENRMKWYYFFVYIIYTHHSLNWCKIR